MSSDALVNKMPAMHDSLHFIYTDETAKCEFNRKQLMLKQMKHNKLKHPR